MIDVPLALVIVTALSGGIWAADVLRRGAAARQLSGRPEPIPMSCHFCCVIHGARAPSL